MDKHEPDTGLSFERVVFFSDAVFAIVLAFVSIFIAPLAFILIPFLARVLDPTSKKIRTEPVPTAESV